MGYRTRLRPADPATPLATRIVALPADTARQPIAETQAMLEPNDRLLERTRAQLSQIEVEIKIAPVRSVLIE